MTKLTRQINYQTDEGKMVSSTAEVAGESPEPPVRGYQIEQSKMRDALKQAQMWACYNGRYSACEQAVDTLEPGQYNIHNTEQGIVFTHHKILSDKLFVLPDSASDEILAGINDFWDKEEHFRSLKFLWKRGILLWGPPGSGKCFQKGTPILMFDGSTKAVEDVRVGDELMGDDSHPRTVLSLASGKEQMYEVRQMNGDPYTVNESHILSLERTTWKKGRYNPHRRTTEQLDIPILDYINSSANLKKEYFGYKASVDFPDQTITVDPYFLGLWLGDGTSSAVEITTMDAEIITFLETYAIDCSVRFVKRTGTTSGLASTYALSGECFVEGSNCILTWLKHLNLINNKHIPDNYKINSRERRLSLLAGLIDSDGYLGNKCFEFSNTNTQLVDDVVFLARSLGFKVSISQKQSYNKQTGFRGVSQSVHISGHTDEIPTRIPRKQAGPRKQIKNPLHTSIDIIPTEVGDYYGFEITGNKRFLLSDFTVVHNTSTIQQISQAIIDRGGISFYVECPNDAAKGLELFRRIEPDRPVLVMLEDIDAIIKNFGESSLLALLDGELQIDNVVFIASTNYPEDLDPRITNRPSRFDVVKKIGMPSPEARKMYLQNVSKMLANDNKKVDEWVNATANYSIAHLKEVIVSVEVFGVPLEAAVKRLDNMINVRVTSDDDDESNDFGFMNK